MADDLRNYQLQLQQVEAALLTDPENEELLKLKTDLEEVIALTKDLINTQEGDNNQSNILNASNDDDITASLLAAEEGVRRDLRKVPGTSLRAGDKCLAKWKADSQFYEAKIEEICGDEVKLIFEGYKTIQTVHVDDVQPIGQGTKRTHSGEEGRGSKVHTKEYLKKKKQKKLQRFKQIEEEREGDKNKWLSFQSKSSKKSGVKTKSIFASPENLSGRVGIGTCGISGRPMTEFTHGEKWKKGT